MELRGQMGAFDVRQYVFSRTALWQHVSHGGHGLKRGRVL